MNKEEYKKELGPEMNWTCGFSPEGPMECLREAVWHGFVIKGKGETYTGMIMMASCDEHRSRMKAHYIHPMDSPCGVTGSKFKWPENFCYIEWEEVMELVGKAELEKAL